MSFLARDYQRAAHDSVLYELGVAGRYKDRLMCDPHTLVQFCPQLPTTGRPVRSTVMNLGTGAGKTVIGGMLADTLASDPSARVLWMADTDELCAQPLDSFQRHGVYAALEKANHKASLMSQVVVASAQTLDRSTRRRRYPHGHFRFAFQDEAHRRTPNAQKILHEMGVQYTIGCTGTAFRTGEGDLSRYFESVAFQLGALDLVGRGYCVPIKVHTVPIQVDLNAVKTRAGDYVDAELNSAIAPYYEQIAEQLGQWTDRHYAVTFTSLVSGSQLFSQICRHHGITAQHVDGQSEDRKEILRRYANKEFRNISCSSLLSTGWDCDICSLILNLRPTKSSALFRQMVGRVLRVLRGTVDGIEDEQARKEAIAMSDKPYALILDLLWDVKTHGLQGPASLLDGNAELAEGVTRAVRQNHAPEDLQEIAQRVQAEVDMRLKKRLDWAARQNAGLFDAQAFAAMIGDHALVNYQPFGRWAQQGVGKFTRQLLLKNGVDPDSVTCEGEAMRIMRAINQRKYLNAPPLQKVLKLPFDQAAESIQRDAREIQRHLATR